MLTIITSQEIFGDIQQNKSHSRVAQHQCTITSATVISFSGSDYRELSGV